MPVKTPSQNPSSSGFRQIAVIAAASVLLAFGCLDGARGEAKPTNFVIIVADDMGWDDCAPYGNRHVQTPNLSRLAKEGMLFEKAFLTCSSCSPSRASILTGRYPHATGAPELHMPLPAEQVTLSQLLRDAGYFTAAAGKWHLGPAAKSKFDMVREGGGAGSYADWLSLLRDRPQDKPFFLWLASSDPHRPYLPDAIHAPHKPAEVQVPPYLPDVPEVRQDLALYYDEIARLDQNVGQVLDELREQEVLDNTLVAFLSDNGRPFPRCKTRVLDSGVRTPLIVRMPGLVVPGSRSKSLVSTVDLAPTILELGGIAPHSAMQGTSLVPVLFNPLATVRQYAYSEHNWHDYMAYERSIRCVRYRYVRNDVPEMPHTPPADAVRSATFQAMQTLREQGKLRPEQMSCFAQPSPEEELYDTESDPHELMNLAGDPALRPVLEEMRRMLLIWQKYTEDFRPTPLSADRYDRKTGLGLTVRKKTRKPSAQNEK